MSAEKPTLIRQASNLEEADALAESYLNPIRVAVTGAAGRMGREVVRAVSESRDMKMVAAIDPAQTGSDAGEIAGVGVMGLALQSDLAAAVRDQKPDVLVDFTVHVSALANIEIALNAGVAVVVGTTGFSTEELDLIRAWADRAGVGALIAPNFAIGAVLMMEFAAQAARYLPNAEIIELHHERKVDAPSGTAMLTARKISEARRNAPKGSPAGEVEKAPGARGGKVNEVRIHSVRLPGYVAHQEVLFGGTGETLSIRHDSNDRRSFMPGVLMAIRKAREMRGLTVGLEHLLFGST